MWYTISVKGKDKIKEQLPAKTTAQSTYKMLSFILSNPNRKIKEMITMKIKIKGLCQTIDRRTVKKVLKDEKTFVICKNYYTDDYLNDALNNFRNGKIENNNEIIEDLYYFRCYTTDMKTITLVNNYSSYIVTNENLEMELLTK